jgi:diguanylate cyclase (GGDEF)-like protein
MELARIERLAGIGTFRIEWTSGKAQWTASAADLLSLSVEAGAGATAAQLFSKVSESHRNGLAEALQNMIVSGEAMSHQALVLRADGEEALVQFDAEVTTEDRTGKVMILGTLRDVTSSETKDSRLRKLVCYDSLTGLPSRLLFREQVGFATRRAIRERDLVAVMSIELDNLRAVNDSLGHDIGDALIKATSQRIARCVRGEDVVATSDGSHRESSLARFNGTQFGVLLSRVREPHDASRVAQRIQEALEEPFMVDGHELYPTALIGVSVWPWDSEEAEGLIRSADSALGQCKLPGKSRLQFFSRNIGAQASDRLAIETGMRRGLEREEFVLFYQPRVDGATGRIRTVEALARWDHPDKGLLLPDAFISIAEQNRFIVPLGEWLLGEACRQIQRWLAQGMEVAPVAVNISAVQFKHPNFINMVKRSIEMAKIAPSYLELEITESIVMQNADTAAGLIRKLKDLGVKISIDDFGTGYSSLSYLRNLDVDALKIDRSFVMSLPSDRKNAAITCAIIDLARRLSLHVVAEGVETIEQRRFLLNNACTEMQGYLFAKPLPAEEMATILNAGGFDLSQFNEASKPAIAATADASAGRSVRSFSLPTPNSRRMSDSAV